MTPAATAPRAASPWLIVGVGMLSALLLVVAEEFGANQLNQLLLYAPGADKVLHFGQSLVLFAAFYLALGRTTLRHRLPIAISMALIAAGLDEMQQRFAGGRSIELADVGAGAAGIALGAGLVVRRALPAIAIATMAGAVASGSVLTYDTHLKVRDYSRGLLAEHAGRMDEARQHYQRGVDAGIANPELLNALAWAILESRAGDPTEAADYARRSLAARPDDADTLDTYGWALHRAGRSAEALAPLQRAFEAKPDIYCIHYHLGASYLAVGRIDEARRHLRVQVERFGHTKEALLAAETLTWLERSGRATP